MVPKTRNGILLLGSLLLLASLPACLPSDAYEACRFPPDQKADCVGKGKTINCLVEHPSCPENYCVSWQGSESFCSQKCKSNSDCPENGCCVAFLLGCDETGNCPSLCVSRDSLATGAQCPASDLPPVDPGIDIPEPDLSAISGDASSAE